MQKNQIRDIRLEEPGAIVRVLHDGETMRVHYRSGGCYEYREIDDHIVDNLVNAASPASYMVRHIMPDHQAIPVNANEAFPSHAWA